MTFKELLQAGKPALGVIVTLAETAVAEIMAQAGFDFLWVDAEHTALGYGDVQRIAQAAGATPCLVRVPAIDEGWVKKTLETGVEGIIFPLVNTRADAERAVALCKYPPEGRRSAGIGRAQAYGPGFAEYVQTANRRTCVVVQIEHVDAVENVEAIIATPGLDAALIGPYDLSNSMGMAGQVDHPRVTVAIERVRQACAGASLPLGIFTTSPEAGRRYLASGFSFAGVGVDATLLANAARAVVRQVKGG